MSVGVSAHNSRHTAVDRQRHHLLRLRRSFLAGGRQDSLYALASSERRHVPTVEYTGQFRQQKNDGPSRSTFTSPALV